MKKITIVINGKGGAGKDTICNIVSKHFPSLNISSIAPIKELAIQCGWNGEKDLKSRQFLSELKRLLIEFNDLPTNYLLSMHQKFLSDKNLKILFVHIRESDQIEAFLKKIKGCKTTLLIKKKGLPVYSNNSDDKVEDFSYNYIYVNDKSQEELEADFMLFFHTLLESFEE